MIAFVQERPGGWSEFLISTPLGSKFVGEGVWGTGVNFDFTKDSRVVIFANGPSLLGFCDMIMMLIEGLDIDKREIELEEQERRNQQTEAPYENKNSPNDDGETGQFVSNIIIDFVVFMDNLDNAYALGYDMVDYLCSQSEEGRIFKSILYLKDQQEDLHDTFDCKFPNHLIPLFNMFRCRWYAEA